MSHKTKYIDVYKKYKEKGLILLSTIYTNNRIPMNCIDKNGFKYSLSYGAIKDKRKQSFNIISPYNKFSYDNIKKQYCIDNNIQLIILPYWWIYNNGKECQKYKDIINKIK